MPVRIYEIAKKVGIPSKEVLAKAKELGITNAKVASSTLDKITAEYLEEKIAGTKEPEPAPVPVAIEPIIITAPVEEPEEEIAEKAEADTSEETEVEAEPEQDAAGEEAAGEEAAGERQPGKRKPGKSQPGKRQPKPKNLKKRRLQTNWAKKWASSSWETCRFALLIVSAKARRERRRSPK